MGPEIFFMKGPPENFTADPLPRAHWTGIRSRLTSRSQLPRDLEKCRKLSCIKIRDNTILGPEIFFMKGPPESFTADPLPSAHWTCIQSWLTSRSQLPRDLEKCRKFSCIKIRDNTILGPEIFSMKGPPKNFTADPLPSAHWTRIRNRLTSRSQLPRDLEKENSHVLRSGITQFWDPKFFS